MLELEGRTVIITGGATGIGFGLAKACGALGAHVVIGEPRQARLDDACEALAQLGVSVRAFELDVTNADQLERFAEDAFAAFGEVALVINNAGIGQTRGSVIDTTFEEMQRVMAVNFEGVWRGCQAFGRRLIDQGIPAGLYNTGSENSFFIAVSHSAAYVASKHGLVGLMRATVQDLVGSGIHSACICPGFTDTAMLRGHIDNKPEIIAAITANVSAGRLIDPREIADTLYFCAVSPVISGAVIHANLGQIEQ